MNDKEISEKTSSIEEKEILTDKEICTRLERINSHYAYSAKNHCDNSKSPTSLLSATNTISPITKAASIPLTKISSSHPDQDRLESVEPKQFLMHKRRFRKINKNKREMSIKVVDCPSDYDIVYNYSYLLKVFEEERDNYSLFNTTSKNAMSNSLFEQISYKDISFGDSPCKLYCDYLLEGKVEKANGINNSVTCLPMFSSGNQLTIPSHYFPKASSYNHSQSQKKKRTISHKGKETELDMNNIESNNDIDGENENVNDGNSSSQCDDNNNNSKQKNTILKKKKYKCTICPCVFASPQGLGGHMSRTHKDQSIKFQNKKKIRLLREPQRKLLEKAKIMLCKYCNQDYYSLIKTKKGKEKIKSLVLVHKKEYKEIRKRLKEDNSNFH